MGMCQVMLIGVVADEPKSFTSQTGYKIATVRVRVDEKKIIKGEKRQITSWHTVKVFGNQAALAAELKQGAEVLAVGDLRRNKYTKNDGSEVVTWEVVADRLQALGAEPEVPQQEMPSAPASPYQAQKQTGDDYVPF